MKVSLITINEIKELRTLIDYIEDERTIELIKKLHGSYNIVYTNYKDKIKENRRANVLEVERDEEIRKVKEKNNQISSLQKNLGKEIDKNIDLFRKLKEAEIKIETLEGKLKEEGIAI